jgi:hypothetical protein
MLNGNAGAIGLTLVGVGPTVATADGFVNPLAGRRKIGADAEHIAVSASAWREFAELVVFRTTQSLDSTAAPITRAVGANRDARLGSLTTIAVRDAVAAANGFINIRTGVRPIHTFADCSRRSAGSRGEHAEPTVVAGMSSIAPSSTLSRIINWNARPPSFATVQVGLSVTSAHGVVNIRTGIRYRRASARNVHAAAGSRRSLANMSLRAATTGAVVRRIAGITARSTVANLYAGLVRFAFVCVGHAVAAANRIEHGRATDRDRPTDPHEIGNVTLPRRKLAELSIIAGQARNPPTAPLAFPAMSDRDAMGGGFAGIPVGNAVTPTDRFPDVWTTRGHKRASAMNIGGITHPGRQLAELRIGTRWTHRIPRIAWEAAFTVVGDANTGHESFTFAAIGLTVTTTNRTARCGNRRI